MKAYWDSAALVEASSDIELRKRLRSERGFTRTHALAEIFSVLTGGANLAIRVDADGAAQIVDNLAADLDFIDLTAQEVRQALKQAKRRGVRGGRVHDFLHAVAAQKAGVEELLTLDENDFEQLLDNLKVRQV